MKESWFFNIGAGSLKSKDLLTFVPLLALHQHHCWYLHISSLAGIQVLMFMVNLSLIHNCSEYLPVQFDSLWCHNALIG